LVGFKDEILHAEMEFISLLNSPRYFSKKDLHLWKQRWNHLAQLVRQFSGTKDLGLGFLDSVNAVADFYERGEQLRANHNAAFIDKELVAFKDLFNKVEKYPLTEAQ
jgi:hypothetical protein